MGKTYEDFKSKSGMIYNSEGNYVDLLYRKYSDNLNTEDYMRKYNNDGGYFLITRLSNVGMFFNSIQLYDFQSATGMHGPSLNHVIKNKIKDLFDGRVQIQYNKDGIGIARFEPSSSLDVVYEMLSSIDDAIGTNYIKLYSEVLEDKKVSKIEELKKTAAIEESKEKSKIKEPEETVPIKEKEKTGMLTATIEEEEEAWIMNKMYDDARKQKVSIEDLRQAEEEAWKLNRMYDEARKQKESAEDIKQAARVAQKTAQLMIYNSEKAEESAQAIMDEISGKNDEKEEERER